MNTEFARQQMVNQQVRAWDVLDATVLQVISTVPRERFVPAGFEALAFADTQIPIGHGQSMMTPTVEGRLLQALGLRRSDNVLEIGTGTGFLTACLASLAASVTSVDIHDEFLRTAARHLEDIGIENVDLVAMDATQELPKDHYDAIAVTGSIQTFDPRYVEALRPGGRLFVIVGDAPAMDARLIRRTGDNDWRSETLFETNLTPILHGALPPQFSF
ncbi:MAG: protein-L-isoaspartate O-methyltransferase [Proteobacteria bacterium]|nr:protein-L-isoaspartate O-methyltransferase [Pseudomonadota bacterium]